MASSLFSASQNFTCKYVSDNFRAVTRKEKPLFLREKLNKGIGRINAIIQFVAFSSTSPLKEPNLLCQQKSSLRKICVRYSNDFGFKLFTIDEYLCSTFDFKNLIK